MNDLPHKALLPAGFPDILPPQAGHEAAVTAALIASLTAQGYERVKPPLVEYEDTLLSGPGAAMAQQTFRLMDPVSQRMMGVRADLTLQIARIAETRLAQSPKPQRLCYAGDVLRVKGDQLRPERQFTQVGAELIDGPAPSADVEVVLLAVGALAEAGARRLSIDLKQPKLVPTLLDEVAPLAGKADALRDALDRKDTARVAELGGDAAATLAALMTATGPAAQAVPALAALDLPKRAAAERDRLLAVVGPVVEALPDVTVTVDPVEHRGFEYHDGVSFTIFAAGIRGELGRGGRYRTSGNGADGGSPATGVTLFMDSVMRSLPPPAPARRVYLPVGTGRDVAARLRGEGWITVAALAPGDDEAEATRHGCGHLLVDDEPRPVG